MTGISVPFPTYGDAITDARLHERANAMLGVKKHSMKAANNFILHADCLAIVRDLLIEALAIGANEYAARPSPSLDEETIANALLEIESFLGDAEHFELADDSTVDVTPAGEALDVLRSALKSTPNQQVDRDTRYGPAGIAVAENLAKKYAPNQQVGRGEKLIALNRKLRGDCPRCGALIVGDVNAPAVSGEGWMKEAAKEIVEYVHNYDKWDWEAATVVRIIARHFPSPEGGGE